MLRERQVGEACIWEYTSSTVSGFGKHRTEEQFSVSRCFVVSRTFLLKIIWTVVFHIFVSLPKFWMTEGYIFRQSGRLLHRYGILIYMLEFPEH